MTPLTTITCRVWHSPRADHAYPWKWAVQNSATHETLEFGREESEAAAKREATEARASWIRILMGVPEKPLTITTTGFMKTMRRTNRDDARPAGHSMNSESLCVQFRNDYTVWRSMDRAPKETYPIEHVQLLMPDGSIVRDAHWAYGGGEEQPHYGPAWFVPVKRADGSLSYYREVSGEPRAWAPEPQP